MLTSPQLMDKLAEADKIITDDYNYTRGSDQLLTASEKLGRVKELLAVRDGLSIILGDLTTASVQEALVAEILIEEGWDWRRLHKIVIDFVAEQKLQGEFFEYITKIKEQTANKQD